MDQSFRDHYTGFWVEWYDLLVGDLTADIDFYRPLINASGGPVLELACGSGRFLVRYLKDGMQIEGLDASAEMLAICRNKLQQQGLSATLHHKLIEEMEFMDAYQTVFITGSSFQHIHDLSKAGQALEKINKSLRQSGTLLLEVFIPYKDILENEENKMKRSWSAEKGKKMLVVWMAYRNDFRNQLQYQSYRYELLQDGQLADQMTDEACIRWYSVNEMKCMLERAGFRHIQMREQNITSPGNIATLYIASKA
jgi:ubiquinone/menaquinone biosynthesis C-methylase UbiE